MKVVVSGVGVVSALGIGQADQVGAMRSGRSGIVPVPAVLSTGNQIPVGELQCTNAELSDLLGLDGNAVVSRTALLGMLAVREAMQDAGIRPGRRVGLVSSTSVGGMDLTEHFFRDFKQNPTAGRLREVVMHDCAASTRAIARFCGITGYATTISTACSSAANAILAGERLIRHGVLDAVVVGGTDSLSAFTLNGFKSLMILDTERCRPFDETRSGLNLGEGAGFLVLQREQDATSFYCHLAGAANRNDAFHQTASSEEGNGAFAAMEQALRHSGIMPEEVDYVNVHGTGTVNNDLSEGRAMLRLFGSQVPPFSSTKAFTGHTLAAAGGIEAVFSALSVKHGYVYPNLNFKQPIEALGMIPERDFQEGREIRAVMSNSFGFGGNCSSLVFTR